MKKIFLLTNLLLLTSFVFAQRCGYADTEYILNKLPSYQVAQTKLDNFSKKWHAEIKLKKEEIKKKREEYQNEKVLLSAEMKKVRYTEIENLEREVYELNIKYFGQGGELDKKREELTLPIREEVLRAIHDVAKEGNYAFILDEAFGAYILYRDNKYDVSDDVLKKLSF